MPSNRRCGYCRQYGHMASKCQLKKDIIDGVRRHVGRQRVDLAELLVKNGYGIGALVKAYHYELGEEIPCLVTQESLDYIGKLQYVDFNNVRYSKQVSTRLYDYSGQRCSLEMDNYYYHARQSFYFQVMPLQTGVRDITATIHISDLKLGPNNNPHKSSPKTNYSWDKYCELLAPSNEGATSREAINAPFMLHTRLGGASVTPILP